MRTRSISPAALLLAGLLAGLLPGCSEKSAGPMPENAPPVTFLSIQGTLPDTVDYRVSLHWWGSDPDGRISGYLIRWNGEWTPPPGSHPWETDPSWMFTTATSDTFAAPTGPVAGGGRVASAADTFRVRAIDDLGLADPVGRTQVFVVHNWAPTLDWAASFRRPTRSLPAVSFAWHPTDFDGHETVRTFRYWLDGADSSAASAHVTSDTVATLIPVDFQDRYGERTLSVQAIDESQTPSNIIRHHWTVEAPPPQHYLLIDNVGSRVVGASQTDAFYRAIMDSLARNDTYVLDMEARGAFQTQWEVYPLLALFRGAVWYSGPFNADNDEFFRTNLSLASRGIEDYLDHGGRLLVIATNALSDSLAHATGGLSFAFARRRLSMTGLFRIGSDSDITLRSGTMVQTEAGGRPESLRVAISNLKVDFIQDAPEAAPLLWIQPGVLSQTHTGSVITPPDTDRPAYLGVLRDAGGWRMAVLSFLLDRTDPQEDRNRISAALFRRVLAD